MKAYIKIDATKELPEANKPIIVFSEAYTFNALEPFLAFINDNGRWFDNDDHPDYHGHIDEKIDWWLKEIDLSELMIEFARECNHYYLKGHSTESALTDFLTQKGIVIKD